ncbi:hypothetical protein A2U01_0035958 [Trifolium medium]|uniref:Uncharacterized protein n=1 Tax=Trifolium medium TaxID=97028 RepID=A0A392PU39_9FABA|nr:hypothetical protein [Trifolium medium]
MLFLLRTPLETRGGEHRGGSAGPPKMGPWAVTCTNNPLNKAADIKSLSSKAIGRRYRGGGIPDARGGAMN